MKRQEAEIPVGVVLAGLLLFLLVLVFGYLLISFCVVSSDEASLGDSREKLPAARTWSVPPRPGSVTWASRALVGSELDGGFDFASWGSSRAGSGTVSGR